MAEDKMTQETEYTGKVLPAPGELDAHGNPLYPYLPNAQLVEVVRLARYLRRPLLLKGEPGCGKTRLAEAVAWELKLPYFAWHVKSTSRARDGIYVYDAVGRLRDAQLAAARLQAAPKTGAAGWQDQPAHYVRWQPLGLAFRATQQAVVLIDEIDKADIDFPNDLLLELDEGRFLVEETGEWVIARQRPLVFITSNDEKDLPDAFLRRCLFHYLSFPEDAALAAILASRFPDAPDELISAAIARFLELRERMRKDKGDASKKPSTSELIDWFEVLRRYPRDEALRQLDGVLPYGSVLLKSWDDHCRYLTQDRPQASGA